MNPPPNREVAIFDAALQLPEDQRARYLDEACAGDGSLRQRVVALLRAHDAAGTFMDRPAVASGAGTKVDKPEEQPGDKIGRYKLLQQIGEGGCGVVYMAEQEEPIRRKVALKVIKLGMDTRQVIARFEAERQALALLDHPNIAKVLDAGATETGRPYFVMELVKAIPITRYSDENNLSTRARLGLFVQVCQAIQHAHQKGIIHRDIKPSNILVADHDGVPVPKIIDFGIAKATTDQRLMDKTVFTAFEQFIGTPAYMSPEQAKLSGLDIDTRSDIYSLGVLLYELLTGHTPFDAKDLLQLGLDGIRRTIREKEPARPSSRLSAMRGADLTAIAKSRNVEAQRLVHLVHGDLDWIVMKALDKDRTRRYDTANGLAKDVQRHLSDEPIIARPPSGAYRFQKLVRRNKLVFAAAALLAIVLFAATGISVWQAVRATRAETLAKQRLAESEAISKFLTQVFQSPDPARDGRTVTVAETLGAAVKKLEIDLANQPERRAKLQAALAETYYALGLYREAVSLQEKSRDFYLAAFGLEQTNTLSVLGSLANSYFGTGHRVEAVKVGEQVLALRLKLNGPEDPDTLKAMQYLAVFYTEDRRHAEALKLREQVLASRRHSLGPEDPATIDAMTDLAVSYDALDRRLEGLKIQQLVMDLSRKINGPEHPRTIKAMHVLANFYFECGHPEEALALREEVLRLRRKVNGLEHPGTLSEMDNLAYSYEDAGREDEALKLREAVVVLRRKVNGPEHPETVNSMNNLADCYCSRGRKDDAIALTKQAVSLAPNEPFHLLRLGTFLAWFGEDAEYESLRCRLVYAAKGTDKAGLADKFAKVYCLRPSTNAVLLAEVLDLERREVALGQNDWYLPFYEMGLGLAEYRNGQYAAAASNLAVAEQTAGVRVGIRGTAPLVRAMSLFRQDKVAEARVVFRQAEAQTPPFPRGPHEPPVYMKPVDQETLINWMIYTEAKALIEAPFTPVPEPSAPK
jgi:serine/threonine protein kinase/tetratricopeptide (TPR) repeat protein